MASHTLHGFQKLPANAQSRTRSRGCDLGEQKIALGMGFLRIRGDLPHAKSGQAVKWLGGKNSVPILMQLLSSWQTLTCDNAALTDHKAISFLLVNSRRGFG